MRERLERARLYFISAGVEALAAALRGGVDIFQLRDKHAGDDELLAKAAIARTLCSQAGALFIVNDRPEIAVAAGADGVHVGQDDAAVEVARAVVGPDRLVGLSTHSPAQVDAAAGATRSARPDYIGVGPVHATPTKAGRPAVGTDLVRYAAAHASVPFFAIGGIHAANAAEVVAAGATRIAVVRAIGEAADPEGAARALRAVVAGGAGVGAA